MPTTIRDVRPRAAELKFLVPPETAGRIAAWARRMLTADPHGHGQFGDAYTTTTLYFDTAGRDVFGRRKSYGRAKYRVRRYDASGVIFLERKLRTDGVLAKRRTRVATLTDLDHHPARDRGGWFSARLAVRALAPVCQVAYDRVARTLATPQGLARLTLDTGLRARSIGSLAFASPDYTPVLPDAAVLELKFTDVMPVAFKILLGEIVGREAESFSKYRQSARALALPPRGAVSVEAQHA